MGFIVCTYRRSPGTCRYRRTEPPEDGTEGIRRTFGGLRLPEGEAQDTVMVEGFIPSTYLQATDDGPGNIVPFPTRTVSMKTYRTT